MAFTIAFQRQGVIKSVLTGVVLLWMAFSLFSRLSDERENNAVEICLDWDETVTLCQLNGYRLDEFLGRAKTIGATSVALGEETIGSYGQAGALVFIPNEEAHTLRLLDLAAPEANTLAVPDENVAREALRQLRERYGIAASLSKAGRYRVIRSAFASPFAPAYWNAALPLGFSREKLQYLEKQGLMAVLKQDPAGKDPDWILDYFSRNVSALLWDREVPGYAGGGKRLPEKLGEQGIKYVALEFLPVQGMSALKKTAPGALVQGHVIPVHELERSQRQEFWRLRWKRAVNERGARFLLVHFWRGKTVEDNLAYLRGIAQDCRAAGYVTAQASPPEYPSRGNHGMWLSFALLAALLFPLLALSRGKRVANPLGAFFAINGISVLGGSLIAALLYDSYFMQRIADMPMIKATLLLPVLLSVFIVYSPREIETFLLKQLAVKHVLAALVILAAAAVLLVRSGNAAAGWLMPDLELRQALENMFSVRPRTKEFLFGQPLLFLGLYYRLPALLVLGMVGQVSILNTFLHAHAPLVISFPRTFYGIGTGLIVAGAAIGTVALVRRILKK